ncbi:MAG: TlpA family protein disulfide reductase [Bacteriovoracaceae bacterium]|nr:TlpA family protein disulfide reductase [Bacteriovoracaceae bacterium]
MKKFLPVMIFIGVFSAVLAGQVGIKKLAEGQESSKNSNDRLMNPNELYEKIFLKTKAKTLEGKDFNFYKIDSPVVVINFWASWCVPCLSEMPSMMKFKSQFAPKDVTIIAINTDEEDQVLNIKKTLKKINLKEEFVIVPDVNTAIATEFNITAIPVTIIFHNGKVKLKSDGPMDFMSEEFLGQIRAMIKK